MRLRITVDGDNYKANLESIKIEKQLAGRSSTASFSIKVINPDTYDAGVYNGGFYDNDGFSFTGLPSQQSEVIIYNDLTGTDSDPKVFRGFVTSVSRTQKNRSFQLWDISCVGLEYLLENITINRKWVGKTDRQIIQDAFSSVLPEITTSSGTVAELMVAVDFEAKDLTLRELVEQISQLSGGEWRVTEEKALSYRAAGSVSAPFGFAADPDNSSTFKWIIGNRTRESTAFANKVTVLGAFAGTAGAELRAVAENTASQTELGRVIEAIVVNREIDNQPALDLAAEIELEKRAVQESITFDFYEDGLEVGMLVSINSIPAQVVGSFVINTLSMRQVAPDRTRYTAQVGDYRGTLAERMRQLDRIKKGPKLQPPIPPPPDSVTDVELADGAVTTLKLASQAVTESRLAVSAVTASILAAAAVTNTKIADNAISTPKLQASSVTSNELASNSVIAGKVAANSIVGSNIQAGSITAANAVFATAAIQNADINTVSASKINTGTLTVGGGGATIAGTLTVGGSLTVSGTLSVGGGLTVSGSISGSTCTFTNMSASAINTGTLNCSSITVSNLSASSINTGTLNCSLITVSNLSASSITTGSMSANRLSGGTIDASSISVINLDASNITTGTLSASRIGAGTISASISLTGATLSVAGAATFSSGVTVSSGNLFCNTQITASGSFAINATTVINSSAAFVGAGVDCPSNGIGGAGFAVYQGGYYFGVTGPTTFTTADSKTVTVRGGIITSIV